MLKIHQFRCLSDNYGYLIHDTESGETVCLDTPEAPVILREAEAQGWQITQIWNTHWHPDHAGGNEAVKAATGCTITAAAAEVARISGIDREVVHGDTVSIGAHEAQVIDVGGHTLGHIAYHLPQDDLAFVGDSVFALGCGRMFEGDPQQFWDSLSRIKALPADTTLYCAHEYTQANAKFAVHADPQNEALAKYAQEIDAKRARDEWTVPMGLEHELATNPFLRADTPEMRERWGGNTPAETFAALRAAKDSF